MCYNFINYWRRDDNEYKEMIVAIDSPHFIINNSCFNKYYL